MYWRAEACQVKSIVLYQGGRHTTICNASRTPHIAKEVESEFISTDSKWWQATRAIAGESNLVKLNSVMVAAMGSCVAGLAALMK